MTFYRRHPTEPNWGRGGARLSLGLGPEGDPGAEAQPEAERQEEPPTPHRCGRRCRQGGGRRRAVRGSLVGGWGESPPVGTVAVCAVPFVRSSGRALWSASGPCCRCAGRWPEPGVPPPPAPPTGFLEPRSSWKWGVGREARNSPQLSMLSRNENARRGPRAALGTEKPEPRSGLAGRPYVTRGGFRQEFCGRFWRIKKKARPPPLLSGVPVKQSSHKTNPGANEPLSAFWSSD